MVFRNGVSIQGVLVTGLLLLALVGCTALQAAGQPGGQSAVPSSQATAPRTITVVGVGKVSLVPDIAQLNVGAEDSAPTVAEAKARVDSQMAAIVAALKEMGITDKDIQTSNYSIYYERQEQVPLAEDRAAAERRGVYHVSNMLLVTVRDVARAGEVLDALVEAGANQVYGVSFTVSDEVKWQSQAREKAMADAKSRAEELARLGGVEVGQVQAISEVIGSVSYPVAVERAAYGAGGGIAPGEQELSMQVQVTYAIR